MKQLGITLSLAFFLLGSIANPSFALLQSSEADNNEFVNIQLQNNEGENDEENKEGDKKSSEKGDKECDKKDKAKKAECSEKKAESKECSEKKSKSQCKSKSSPTEN